MLGNKTNRSSIPRSSSHPNAFLQPSSSSHNSPSTTRAPTKKLKTASTTTSATATPPAAKMSFEFLSLPGEIRNKIYRLVLCDHEVIDNYTYSQIRASWGVAQGELHKSAQLLRTCRQIHTEAMPILYGENTFQIDTNNYKGGGGYLKYAGALGPVFYQPYWFSRDDDNEVDIREQERNREQWRQDRARRCSLLRRFHVVICYDGYHPFADIRESIREITSLLLHKREGTTSETDNDDDTGSAAAPTTTIDYLSLEFHGSGMYIHDVGPDATQKQFLDMIIARLGQASGFRGVVKEVGPITGLPEKIAATLRQTWRQQRQPKRLREEDVQDCGDETRHKRQRHESEQDRHEAPTQLEPIAATTSLPSLVQRWEALNGYVKWIQVHKEDHKTAMLAADREDTDEFHASKRKVIQQLKDLVKKIEDDELLR